MELYWTIVAALFAGVWAIINVIRDQIRQAVADSREIMTRLLAADQLSIGYPDIQKYLSATALEVEDYFRDEARLKEEIFFKSKSYVYAQLNLFDEILSVSTHGKARFFVFKSPTILEIANWEAYIKHIMTHPLYRSILNKEQTIFGGSLQSFWNRHKREISNKTPDPFSW